MVPYNNVEIWQWFIAWIYDMAANKSYVDLYLSLLAPVDIFSDYT